MKKIFNTTIGMALVAAVVFISGCSKTPVINGYIKTISESQTAGGATTTSNTTLTYDAQNRLSIVQQGTSTPVQFSYGSGSITQTQGSQVTIFTLNSAGLVVSDNQGNSYVYDNNGYNTTTTNNGVGGTTTINTISNGNVANSSSTTNSLTTTYAYTYLTTTDYRNYGQSYFGKSSKNLIGLTI